MEKLIQFHCFDHLLSLGPFNCWFLIVSVCVQPMSPRLAGLPPVNEAKDLFVKHCVKVNTLLACRAAQYSAIEFVHAFLYLIFCSDVIQCLCTCCLQGPYCSPLDLYNLLTEAIAKGGEDLFIHELFFICSLLFFCLHLHFNAKCGLQEKSCSLCRYNAILFISSAAELKSIQEVMW